MIAFFETQHPSEGYDIIVSYTADSLKIDNVTDTEKCDITLSEADIAILQQEVEAYHNS